MMEKYSFELKEISEINRKTEIRVMIALLIQIGALTIQLISVTLLLVALRM